MANKKKRCKTCREYVDVSTGIQTPAGFFCSFAEAIKFANDKGQKKARIEHKRAKVQRKRDFDGNDRGKQLDLTQPVFNKMRRLEELLWFRDRGIEPFCISCGNPLGGDQWCCGHFKTTAAQGGLRFDERNTFLQHNVRCNRGLSGDIEGTKTTRGYKAGLLERFGAEEGQAIIDYCESNTQVVKWTCAELIEMRKGFSKRVRELEKELSDER